MLANYKNLRLASLMYKYIYTQKKTTKLKITINYLKFSHYYFFFRYYIT